MMELKNVTMVRVFLTEGDHLQKKILDYLHDEIQVKGVTIFRGISGYGASGHLHTSSLVDLSLDLPIVIEFFDEPDKIEKALPFLHEKLDAGHFTCWSAQTNLG